MISFIKAEHFRCEFFKEEAQKVLIKKCIVFCDENFH